MNDISSSYDQDIFLVNDNVQRTFDLVDATLDVSHDEKNPARVFQLMLKLREEAQIKGLAMAKLLSKLEEQWNYYVLEGGIDDDFYDRVQVDIGISKQTAQKYIRMWRNVFENTGIEQSIKDRLARKPIKNLLLLSAAAKDGDIQDWGEVASTSDYQELHTLVRKQRGERTSSKTSIAILLERDGTLKCRKGSTPFKPFGFINLELKDDEVISEAISKLIERTGIVER